MLKIFNSDNTVYDTITEYNFQEFIYGNINIIEISGNADELLGKICYIYDLGKLVGSGIIEKYSFNKNLNKSNIEIYPLQYDLRGEFLDNGTVGENIIYFNDSFENILEYVINQYRTKVSNPLLYMKTPITSTGITIKYTFNNKTLLEAWNILVFTFLGIDKNIKIDPDGGITIITSSDKKNLTFKKDVLTINYNKKIDEIINYIVFDNKLSGVDHIYKIYQDTASITEHKRRVKYWDDQRIKYEETADEIVNAYLSKYKNPIIEIEDITTTNLDIDIYNQVTISNWDKTFDDDIYVVGVSYIKNGIKKLKLGTQLTRSVLSREDDQDSISEALDYLSGSIPTLPDYIKETYIDSTEIRSPNIAGNAGYFSNQMRVGPLGIVIDGINKLIKSNNYASGSAGWQINNDGNAEFNNATLRGNLLAGTVNINNNFTVDNSGNARGNDFTNKTIFFEKLGSTPSYNEGKMWCEGNPTNKVLWGYFGGDTQKQQISTSRMQYSGAFDRTSSTSYTYNTWFQPRLLIFNGFFEKIADKIYGTTNGQAGSVSSSQGFCNSTNLKFSGINSIQNISATTKNNVVSDLNFTSSGGNLTSASWMNNTVLNGYSWSYNTIDAITEIYTAAITDAFGTDSVTKNCYAYVSSWTDTGITIQVVVPSGWRLGGAFTIFG